MPSKEEKEKRKQIHKEIARKEYENFIKGLPIDKSLILELFDYLDSELSERDCNHDYQITLDFMKSKNINSEKTIEWFQEQGGYCDCEILYNIEEKFKE